MQEYGDNWLYHYHDIMMKEEKQLQKKLLLKKTAATVGVTGEKNNQIDSSIKKPITPGGNKISSCEQDVGGK